MFQDGWKETIFSAVSNLQISNINHRVQRISNAISLVFTRLPRDHATSNQVIPMERTSIHPTVSSYWSVTPHGGRLPASFLPRNKLMLSCETVVPNCPRSDGTRTAITTARAHIPLPALGQPHITGFLPFPVSNFKHYLTLFSKFFSSFPHGTCSLSVSRRYLALEEIYLPLSAAIPNNATR